MSLGGHDLAPLTAEGVPAQSRPRQVGDEGPGVEAKRPRVHSLQIGAGRFQGASSQSVDLRRIHFDLDPDVRVVEPDGGNAGGAGIGSQGIAEEFSILGIEKLVLPGDHSRSIRATLARRRSRRSSMDPDRHLEGRRPLGAFVLRVPNHGTNHHRRHAQSALGTHGLDLDLRAWAVLPIGLPLGETHGRPRILSLPPSGNLGFPLSERRKAHPRELTPGMDDHPEFRLTPGRKRHPHSQRGQPRTSRLAFHRESRPKGIGVGAFGSRLLAQLRRLEFGPEMDLPGGRGQENRGRRPGFGDRGGHHSQESPQDQGRSQAASSRGRKARRVMARPHPPVQAVRYPRIPPWPGISPADSPGGVRWEPLPSQGRHGSPPGR